MRDIKKFGPSKNSRFVQGTFDEYNPKKYIGPKPIIFRSSWEKTFMLKMEANNQVESWSSESITIPYILIEKTNGKTIQTRHNYTPDFIVIMKSGKKFLIEVKPNNQIPLNESMMGRDPVMLKNACKWNAALKWCKNNDYEFKLVTENHLKTKIF